jgi:hypothetical protein
VWWDVDEAGNIYSMRHASQYQYNGDDAQGLFFPNKYEFVRINPDGTEHSYGVHECFPEFPEEWDPEQLVRIDQKQRFYFMRPVAAVDSVSGCSWDMEFVRINEDGTEFSLGVHCVDLKDHWTVSHVVWAVSGDGTLTIWKGKDLYNVAEDGAVSHLLSFNNSSLPPWLVMENENFFIRNTNPKSDEWDHDGFVRINKDGTMCSLGYGVGAFDSRGNLYRMEGETLMRYSDSDKGVSIVTLNGSAPCRVYPYSKGLVLAIKEDDRWHLYSIEVR